MPKFFIFLVLFSAACSPQKKTPEDRMFSENEMFDRLKKCWDVEHIEPDSSDFRVKYEMYLSFDAGPWVGVSKKCEKSYISFNDPENVFQSVRQKIRNGLPDEPFQTVVIQLEVVGATKPQRYNTLHIEYDLKKIVGVEKLDIDPDDFYQKYVVAHR